MDVAARAAKQVITEVYVDNNKFITKDVMHNFFQSPEWALQRFTEMASTNSNLLGNFLGEVLKKEYPHLNTNDWITLEVLLSWALWPSYLKIVQQGMIFMRFCSNITLN